MAHWVLQSVSARLIAIETQIILEYLPSLLVACFIADLEWFTIPLGLSVKYLQIFQTLLMQSLKSPALRSSRLSDRFYHALINIFEHFFFLATQSYV